jgi:predicted nucleic acid-binding protein
MIAVDTNILVYAHREDFPFQDTALRRVAELAEGSAVWAIPWPCIHEFLAIVTHPHIYAPPTPLDGALDQVDAWLESPTLAVLAESGGHWPTLRGLLAEGRVVGAQVHDARVAALCLQHGVCAMVSGPRLQPLRRARGREPAAWESLVRAADALG